MGSELDSDHYLSAEQQCCQRRSDRYHTGNVINTLREAAKDLRAKIEER